MAALAEAADVAAELGLPNVNELTTVQASRMPGLLAKASAQFRRAAGNRQFTPGDYTHRVHVVGGRARLPEPPVTAIASVVDDSGNAVGYSRSGEWINVSRHHDTDASFGCYRPDDLGSGWFVTVSYTGGAVPDEVRATIAQIVVRALNANPLAGTGVKSHEQTMGPFTERSQFFDWAADAATLTADEFTFAQSFRYPGTNLIVHRQC